MSKLEMSKAEMSKAEMSNAEMSKEEKNKDRCEWCYVNGGSSVDCPNYQKATGYVDSYYRQAPNYEKKVKAPVGDK